MLNLVMGDKKPPTAEVERILEIYSIRSKTGSNGTAGTKKRGEGGKRGREEGGDSKK